MKKNKNIAFDGLGKICGYINIYVLSSTICHIEKLSTINCVALPQPLLIHSAQLQTYLILYILPLII